MAPSSSTSPAAVNDPETLRLVCDQLKATGAARYHVRGRSMLPTLQEGWKLHIRSIPARELRVGDIALFVHGNGLTVHRLVWKKTEGGRDFFILQGDNSPARESVAADAILGRVEAAEGDWSREGAGNPIPVGSDSRALFYRTAFALHSRLTAFIPAAAVPGEGASGGPVYRCLRACFRLLEPLFSPRPRR